MDTRPAPHIHNFICPTDQQQCMEDRTCKLGHRCDVCHLTRSEAALQIATDLGLTGPQDVDTILDGADRYMGHVPHCNFWSGPVGGPGCICAPKHNSECTASGPLGGDGCICGTSAYRECGKPTIYGIPRMGLYYTCVLQLGHKADCQPGGNCVAHGKYVGVTCPKCPGMTFFQYAEPAACEKGISAFQQPLEKGWLATALRDVRDEVNARDDREAFLAHHRQVEEQLAAAMAALEDQRSSLCAPIKAIYKAIHQHEWLKLGRGSYEYNDDRWRDEFGQALGKIETAIEPLKKIAADWSNCPKDSAILAQLRKERLAHVAALEAQLAELKAAPTPENPWISTHDRLPELPSNGIEASEDVIGALIDTEGTVERCERMCRMAHDDNWAKDGRVLSWYPNYWMPIPKGNK